jgi:predicted DNA-binding transcriptional regulator YafY
MPLNRNTLMRIRTIDACLQRRQRRWTIEDLRQACADALYDYEGIDSVSLRTVQRDIELMRSDKLGYYAPIVVRDRKYYEYEDPDFSITQLPLSQRDLEELSSAMDIIKHYQGFQGMAGQEDVLARMQDNLQFQSSHHQIVYIDTNTKLKGLHFLSCLYDHIAKKEPIILEYQSFKSTRPKSFYLSPYLLKEFNNRWFLFAYNKLMRDVQTLAIDRIVSVSYDDKGRYVENTFFNPDTYFDDMVGVTRSLNSQKEVVTLRFDTCEAPYILTKPMHSSQQLVKKEENGRITISLNVIINLELERLILGFGCHVEVLAPRLLRTRIARNVNASTKKYRQ